MNPRTKNLVFWVVVCLFMFLLFHLFQAPTQTLEEEIIFSEFVDRLEKGEISKVSIKEP
ncbi:MAG TPA: ATP-dependent metallopeptidase FtsH/Yme1/Tma family protein, partial [Nitrospiria bacterium]